MTSPAPRVVQIRLYTTEPRRKPQVGDRKVTADGRVFVRRRERIDGCDVVRNGRPAYEWVATGEREPRP